MNNHVFKGHRALLGSKYITYGEVELPTRYEMFTTSPVFDWGSNGSPSIQLSYSMLYQVSQNKKLAEENAIKFTSDIVSKLHSRDWILNAKDVQEWINTHCENIIIKKPEPTVIMKKLKPIRSTKRTTKPKTNVIKSICKELEITQKNLAEILEVPEGTVSSWAVKNEIPRLGKKAIEFYILSVKNQKIVDSYRSFKKLLEVS